MESDKRRAARRGGTARAVLAGLAAIWAGNPMADAQVYGVALPDITNKTLIVRPDAVPAGGTVEIVSAVQNLGMAALIPRYRPAPPVAAPGAGERIPVEPPAPPPPTLVIRFMLVSNVKNTTGIPAGEWGLDALDQRDVERQTVLWTVPAETTPDTWYLCADVDPDHNVRESNDLNNRTCQRLIVKPALEPEEAEISGLDGDDVPVDEAAPTEENSTPGFSGLEGAETGPDTPN